MHDVAVRQVLEKQRRELMERQRELEEEAANRQLQHDEASEPSHTM